MSIDAPEPSPQVKVADIETPPGGGGLFAGPMLPAIAARIGVRLLRRPLRVGRWVLAARRRDVADVLRRDLDFQIAPVNASRMEAVDGPFILARDGRSATARSRC